MRSLLALLLILVLQPLTFAGPSGFASRTDDESELWRVRSQGLTDDLLKDGSQLSSLRRAVLWARLAQTWWSEDRSHATTWFRNATEVVEQVPNKEGENDRSARLATARFLLKVAASLDQKLTIPLIKILTTDDQVTGTERDLNIEAIMNTAVALVDKDLKRAVELGALALRLGPPNDIASLLFAVRKRDPKSADKLFVQAMSIARQKPFPVQILNSLTYAAFPQQRKLGEGKPAPPENLRAELLQLQVAFLNSNPIDADNQGSVCWNLSSFIVPVLSEFERLLPPQAEVVRQAVNKCQSADPSMQQQFDSSIDSQPANTVEALLEAASDATNVQTRTMYEYRAANLAVQKKDYELALKILDSMSKEGRELMSESWDWYRADWAAAAALDHYERGRLFEMNLVLNSVPPDLQPLAKVVFVDRLPERRDPERDPTTQLLNDAKAGLRRTSVSESNRYGCYFVLLRSIVKYQPADAGAVLKEGIASLNRAEPANKMTLDTPEFGNTLPASLLEMDEFVVREGLASIAAVETRAQLRLELLKATLQRLKAAQSSASGGHLPQDRL